MKKSIYTLVFALFCLGGYAQNILIEKSLFSSPRAIDVKGVSSSSPTFYFTSASEPNGLYVYDLKTMKLALDTTIKSPLGHHEVSSVIRLLQPRSNSLFLRNSITKDSLFFLHPTDSVTLPKFTYNPTTDYFYGVLDSQTVLRASISFDGLKSLDTVQVPQTNLHIKSISFFEDRIYYAATKNDTTSLYLLDDNEYVRLRYPLNFGEDTYGIQILSEDSLIVTRKRRAGEHELALLYATKIAMHPDSIQLIKQRALEKTTYDSIYTKDSVFVTESSLNTPRNTGKGRWALLVSRTTDAFKAMLTLNELLKIEPRAYSIKKDSVYFILGPRQLSEDALKTDSLYFAENGFSSLTYDLKQDSSTAPFDITVRLECLDAATGKRPPFRVDFYEYETNTLVKSTEVQEQEVCYLTYYPEYTLGLTVTAEGYLPYSKRFEPLQALNPSKRLEILALLQSQNLQKEQSFTLKNIYFDFDRYELKEVAKRELALVKNTLQEASTIHISGHTDNVGSEEYNQALSEKRAQAASAYITTMIEGPSISTEGKGETQPVATNNTEAGRAENRRCEVQLNSKAP